MLAKLTIFFYLSHSLVSTVFFEARRVIAFFPLLSICRYIHTFIHTFAELAPSLFITHPFIHSLILHPNDYSLV
jgi:hypothetical protein